MKLVKVIFKTEETFKDKDAEGLRGYFGNVFKDKLLFHNHRDSCEYNYTSPSIQYKIIDGKLAVVGINEGADLLLEEAEKIREIKLKNRVINVTPKIEIEFPEVRITNTFQEYEFQSVWFALNQVNYIKYKENKLLLSIQLRNNIIEFFKMCGLTADKEIFVEGKFEEKTFFSKQVKMTGFLGNFKTNVLLPDDISLGKRKSIGLGRIRKK